MPLIRKAGLPDLFAIALLLLLSVLIVDRLLPFGAAATTPDSLSYLETARSIAAGHGIAIPDRSFNSTGDYRPMTTWPPLYPLLLAPLTTPEVMAGPRAAALLSGILLASTALLCYALFRRSWRPTGAALAAAAVCLSSPSISVFAYAWSEALFLPLLALAALLAAIAAGSTQARQAGAAFIGLALTLALLFATRYAGWPLALLLPAVFLLNRPQLRLPVVACSLALYGAICGALLARNLALSGHLSGSRRTEGEGLASVLGNFGNTLALYLTPGSMLLLALLLAAGLAFLVHRTRAASAATNPTATARLLPWLAAAMAVIYVVVLIMMSAHSKFDPLDQRLLSPFLLLLLIAALAAMPVAAARRHHLALATCALLSVLIVLPGIFQWLVVKSNWEQQGGPRMPANVYVKAGNFTKADNEPMLGAALAKLAAPPTLIYSDQPLMAEFLTGLPARQLPKDAPSQDALHQMKAQPGAALLLIKRAPEFIAFAQAENLEFSYHAELLKRGVLLTPLDSSFTNP